MKFKADDIVVIDEARKGESNCPFFVGQIERAIEYDFGSYYRIEWVGCTFYDYRTTHIDKDVAYRLYDRD